MLCNETRVSIVLFRVNPVSHKHWVDVAGKALLPYPNLHWILFYSFLSSLSLLLLLLYAGVFDTHTNTSFHSPSLSFALSFLHPCIPWNNFCRLPQPSIHSQCQIHWYTHDSTTLTTIATLHLTLLIQHVDSNCNQTISLLNSKTASCFASRVILCDLVETRQLTCIHLLSL